MYLMKYGLEPEKTYVGIGAWILTLQKEIARFKSINFLTSDYQGNQMNTLLSDISYFER